MIKYSITFVLLALTFTIRAQSLDTLSNLEEGTSLYAPRYTDPGQWGYILGQNSAYRQQYAEKYHIEGGAKVKGIITHLTGVYEHPENYVEFNVYRVSENGLPGKRLGGRQIFYKDIDLSGNAMYIHLNTAVNVADSFFVTFNVLDYLHGGYDGDTLGLMAGEPGSRPTEDLGSFGRNAVQAHNHSKEEWKDFYTQNFTPIATHFALFPIVEYEDVSLEKHLSWKNFRIYPNPSEGRFFIDNAPGKLSEVHVINTLGQVVLQRKVKSDEKIVAIDIREQCMPGAYILLLRTGEGSVSTAKIMIE